MFFNLATCYIIDSLTVFNCAVFILFNIQTDRSLKTTDTKSETAIFPWTGQSQM